MATIWVLVSPCLKARPNDIYCKASINEKQTAECGLVLKENLPNCVCKAHHIYKLSRQSPFIGWSSEASQFKIWSQAARQAHLFWHQGGRAWMRPSEAYYYWSSPMEAHQSPRHSCVTLWVKIERPPRPRQVSGKKRWKGKGELLKLILRAAIQRKRERGKNFYPVRSARLNQPKLWVLYRKLLKPRLPQSSNTFCSRSISLANQIFQFVALRVVGTRRWLATERQR